MAALLPALLATRCSWAGPFDVAEDAVSKLPFQMSGLLDFRYAHTSQQRSWLQNGSNKLRYGGRDIDNDGRGDRDANVAAVSQASLVFDIPVQPEANIHLQTNFHTDPESGSGSVSVVQAFGELGHRFEHVGANLRGGALIPPVSWEHPEAAWSTRYTLTPSVIGSWIGEELRVAGAEGALELEKEGQSARLTAAAFTGGDQIGLILFKRGWAMHDYQAGINDTLPLPNGLSAQPFRELDGRAGYYGRMDFGLGGDLLKLGGGWWDNNGNINAKSSDASGTLATWGTQFWDGGGKLSWKQVDLIGQYVRGRSASATTTRDYWNAWYGLGAAHAGPLTFSGRYDQFRVQRLEYGYALTGAVQWDRSVHQRLSLEYIYLRAQPNLAVSPRSEKDQIVQFNYRFKFGGPSA